MKKLFTLLAIAMFFVPFNSNGQCVGDRYKLEIFSAFNLSSNIQYGNNINYAGFDEDLELDVYEPNGDTLSNGDSVTDRPLIILAHGGSFIGGSKTGSDVVPLAQSFAKMGYVVASINYRLGFQNPFAIDSIDGTETVVRAVHDYRAAIRYFKKDFSENANTYGIDTSLIFVGGVSAGAITAVHVAYMDNPLEIPNYIDTNQAGLGGGIEGLSGNAGYQSEITAVINIAGALRDTNWMNIGDLPILSFHGDVDVTVPYATDVIPSPLGGDVMRVDGSFSMHARANNIGLENCFHTHFGAGHVPHTGNAIYTDTTIKVMANFMSSFVCNETLVCGTNDTLIDFSVDPNAPNLIYDKFEERTKIYPNPSSGIINIESPFAIQSIQLTNLLGEIVILKSSLNLNKTQLSKNNLPNGVYILTLNTINGPIVKKISFN